MDLGLRGKVAIVTGAAEGGLGDAMAARLLDEGCRVVAVDEWDATLDTNLRAMWLLAKAAVPSMGERGGGSVVNIGSITVLIGMANILPYVASKGGVIGLTRAMARE